MLVINVIYFSQLQYSQQLEVQKQQRTRLTSRIKGPEVKDLIEIFLGTVFALSAQQAFFQAICMGSVIFSFGARGTYSL